jgi:3',5'-cyclic AMP phosphodiesterase CpdA
MQSNPESLDRIDDHDYVFLHLSDLHCGKQFQPTSSRSFAGLLDDALKRASAEHGLRIKYILCTGDLAESGELREFNEARALLAKIAEDQGVPASRIIICPGNHDITWRDVEPYHHDSFESRPARHFLNYLNTVQRLSSHRNANEALRVPSDATSHSSGIFGIYHMAESNVLVVSLNSAVLESDLSKDHYGFVGRVQLDSVDTELQAIQRIRPQIADAFRIVLVHHPLMAPDSHDASAMRDPIDFTNWLLRNYIGLVLHGHQHYPRCMRYSYPQGSLLSVGAGSLSIQSSGRPDSPMSFNIIRVNYARSRYRNIHIQTGQFQATKREWYIQKEPGLLSIGTPPEGDAIGLDRSAELKSYGLDGHYRRSVGHIHQFATDEAISIHGRDTAFMVYREGLAATVRQLRATSVLHSQFWRNKPSIDNVLANQDAVRRNVSCKRLFFIDGPMEEYVDLQIEEAMVRHRKGDPSRMEELEQLAKNLRALGEMKRVDCRIVVPRRVNTMPVELDPLRAELALFDDVRLDIYPIDAAGSIDGVKIWRNVGVRRRTFEETKQFFDEEWKRRDAIPVLRFVELLDGRLRSALSSIQYCNEWMVKFLRLISSSDPILSEEMEHTIAVVRSKAIRAPGRHLDVGSCTGRYCERFIQEQLVSTSIALDADPDCCDYLRGLKRISRVVDCDVRGQLPTSDLGSFDVVTCMLGTANHFGLVPDEHWDNKSGFAAAIANMVQALTADGLLVLSLWKPAADNSVLSIYADRERARLKQQTPKPADVQAAVSMAGAVIDGHHRVSRDQLDIYLIRPMRSNSDVLTSTA